MGRNTQLSIEDDNGRQLAIYKVNYGSKLFFKDGDIVDKGKKVAEWDPYTLPVIAETGGIVNYMDLMEGLGNYRSPSLRFCPEKPTDLSNRLKHKIGLAEALELKVQHDNCVVVQELAAFLWFCMFLLRVRRFFLSCCFLVVLLLLFCTSSFC